MEFWILLGAVVAVIVGYPYIRFLVKRLILVKKLKTLCRHRGYLLFGTHPLWFLGGRSDARCDFYIEMPEDIVAVKLFDVKQRDNTLVFTDDERYFVRQHIGFISYDGAMKMSYDGRRKPLARFDFRYRYRDEWEIKRSRALLLIHPICREIRRISDGKEVMLGAGDAVGGVAMEVRLDDDGRVSVCDKTAGILRGDPSTEKRVFSFLRREREETAPCVTLAPCKNEFYKALTASAIGELSRLFESIASQLFERFCPIRAELDFYEVALRYVDSLREKGIDPIFPQMSADGGTRVEGLRDVLLTLTFPSAAAVVPHTLNTDSGSVLVFGDNGSGKTVFLRSMGTLQLLAQAGLPVAADRAVLTVCDGVFTQYSEGEKDFCEGNRAGRFEQEVRELAEFVETLSPRALVLLNETFQSTSYEEGAAGLWPILRYFSDRGARWILVSHLRMLEPMAVRDGVSVLHMQKGHRFCP